MNPFDDVIDATEELTYAELQARANRFAHELVEAGVEPGSLVGILMDRQIPLLVLVQEGGDLESVFLTLTSGLGFGDVAEAL